MIKREIQAYLQSLAAQFPVIAVMGPRQSGKTTLVKETFTDYFYISLEDLDNRAAAQEDPRNFFATYTHHKGLIIDEIQQVPELFSYMQGIVDEKYRPGYFVITGSQNFLMHKKITQSLAGRIALLTLLPFSMDELASAEVLPADFVSLLIKGAYPRVYTQSINVHDWCTNYISTYIEKDVRNILNISNVIAFQRFLKLCAALIGNQINYTDLARNASISPNTVKSWISILEASFIIKLLPPYYRNFNKRVSKTPKLYFYDSALACSLLGIKTTEDLIGHPLKGGLFESLIISEIFKYHFNHQQNTNNIYFWRENQGCEIDCIIEKSFGKTHAIEIKSGQTITDNFFKGLINWKDKIVKEDFPTYLIYGGKENKIRKNADIFGWPFVSKLLKKIYSAV